MSRRNCDGVREAFKRVHKNDIIIFFLYPFLSLMTFVPELFLTLFTKKSGL